MRVLGPKEYLENLKYQKINEEVFNNDINWGDSLVGRMFSSVGRKVSDTYDNKKIEDLLKKLKDEINVQALPTVVKENPDLKESADKVKLGAFINSLIDLLDKGDINGVKKISQEDEFESVLNKLPEDSKNYLTSLISDTSNESEEDSDVSVGNVDQSLKDFSTIVDTIFTEGYITFDNYTLNENIANFDQFKVLIKRDKDLIKKNLKKIFIEVKNFNKNSNYNVITSVKNTKDRKISELSKQISDFFKAVKDGKIDIKNNDIKNKILKLKINEKLINEEFEWDDINTLVSDLKKIDTTVDPKSLEDKDASIKDIKQFPINSIRIVRIFNDAARLFIKQRIPSSRSGGKISNSRAADWEKIDRNGSVEGVNPDAPGAGPFRRISMFQKWNQGVLNIIDEYDYIISNAVIKRKDGTIVKNKEGDNASPLKSFMVDSLERPEMQISGGAQSSYLKSHLGMDDKNIDKLDFDTKSKKEIESKKINKGDTKWEWVDSKIDNLKDLKGLIKFKIKSPVEISFRKLNTKSQFPIKDDGRWIYLYIVGGNKNDKNEYKYWGIFSDRDDWVNSPGYSTESDSKIQDNNIYYCEIKLNKESIEVKNVYDIFNNKGYEKGDKVDNFTFRLIKVVKKYLKGTDIFQINDTNLYIKGCKLERGLQKV